MLALYNLFYSSWQKAISDFLPETTTMTLQLVTLQMILNWQNKKLIIPTDRFKY